MPQTGDAVLRFENANPRSRRTEDRRQYAPAHAADLRWVYAQKRHRTAV